MWEKVVFVHTASTTLSDDAHGLSRWIVPLLDIVPTLLTRFIPSTYVSLFLPLQFCCSGTHKDAPVLSWRWETPCSALSPLSLSPRHIRLLLCIICIMPTHTQRCTNTLNAHKQCFMVSSTHNCRLVQTAGRWLVRVNVCVEVIEGGRVRETEEVWIPLH